MLFGASTGFYGRTGEVGSSAQSMILLGKCTMLVSIREYLFFFVAVNTLLALAAALFVWMWLEVFTNRLLCPGDILYEYRNFNLGGIPVNCLSAVIVLAVCVIAVSSVVLFFIREKRRPVSSAGKIARSLAVSLGRLNEGYHRVLSRLSAFGFELYKMLMVNRGIFFLALWFAALFMQLDFTEVTFIGTRAYINAVYAEYQGEDDGRLREYIAEAEEELALAEQEYEEQLAAYENGDITRSQLDFAARRYESYSSMAEAVSQIGEQLAYAGRLKEERGIAAWIVNERPYKILWTANGLWDGIGYDAQEFLAITDLLLMMFLISSIFSYDKACGMYGVIRCTAQGGKKLFGRSRNMLLLTVEEAMVRKGEKRWYWN